jgi:hypothetical protein
MAPKGCPRLGTLLVLQLTCLCLLFSPNFAASQPLPEVVVPGVNPFYPAPPRKKPGPVQGLPFQTDGGGEAGTSAAALPAAEPPTGEQVFPCSCTTTGMSGTANTSTVGCGQWLLTENSNVFMCYIAVSYIIRKTFSFLSLIVFDKNWQLFQAFLPNLTYVLFCSLFLFLFFCVTRIQTGATSLKISLAVLDFQALTSKFALLNALLSKATSLL